MTVNSTFTEQSLYYKVINSLMNCTFGVQNKLSIIHRHIFVLSSYQVKDVFRGSGARIGVSPKTPTCPLRWVPCSRSKTNNFPVTI